MTETDIAVIGLAGRFPGAADLDGFWRNLVDGVESSTAFDDEDLLRAGVDPQRLSDPALVRRRPVLDGVDRFDAGFFGYTPREAALIDPQQRLFLECSWEAFEMAGYDTSRYRGAVGVFAACGPDLYLMSNVYPNSSAGNVGSLAALLGSGRDFIASRVSYKLDLRGPSMSVLAGCSSSLVAIHLATQSLLAGESDMALAGGSTIYFPQRAGYLYRDGSLNSPTGRCRAFDARADGAVPGDGAAVVVLKRLVDALADGDTVHGVVKGTAVNNDGGAKAGFSAPSVAGQREVVAEALAVANVAAESISYVEAHGTGTPMGDAIEVAALAEAFASDRRGYCWLGTVKPNVGDGYAAAGVTGLVKVLLSFAHDELPPTIGCVDPNPELRLAETPFVVATHRTPWSRTPGAPRRAGLHAFGAGGTNAHLVVEEPPAAAAVAIGGPDSGDNRSVLVLSARSTGELAEVRARLAEHLLTQPGIRLPDVAYTLQVGRHAFAHRVAVVAGDVEAAVRALQGSDAVARRCDDTAPSVVLLAAPGDKAAPLLSSWIASPCRVGDAPAVASSAGTAPPPLTVTVPPSDRLLDVVGGLWCHGVDIDWTAVAGGPPARSRVVLPTYPFQRRRHWIDPPGPRATAQLPSEPASDLHPRPDLAANHTPARTPVEQAITSMWSQEMGIEGLGVHDDFHELGGHSLLAMRLSSRIGAAFPIEITAADLLAGCPTIAATADLVERRLWEALEVLTDTDAATMVAELGSR